jgi:hypothetical protein
MASGRAADREDPSKSRRNAARNLDRDLISELHQGQRSHAPHRRAGHMTAPDHFAKTDLNPFAGGGRSLIAPPLSTAFRLFLSPYRGHGSLRGRKYPPQHLVRSTGAAMSTAGSHGIRGPRPSVAVACTLAPSGNHHIRDDARMDPGKGILSRPPVARTSGMAPPTATCYAGSRRVFGQAPRAPCQRLISWQSPGPSPSGLKPV